jgi:diphthine methyl ester acylhydrolase
MASIQSSSFCTIGLPPSCIEFVPDQRPYLLIGTYSLLQPDIATKVGKDDQPDTTIQPQEREGSIIIMKLEDSRLEEDGAITVDHGVLDLRFSPTAFNLFATANSTSSVSIYSFVAPIDGSGPKIYSISTIDLNIEKCLVLAIAWHPTRRTILAATLSNGQVILIETLDSFLVPQPKFVVSVVARHELEAWTLSFSQNLDILYSGADDCVLSATKLWFDLLYEFDFPTTRDSENLMKNRKIHSAGVTAILPLDDYLFLTGSYDDHIRVLDMSSISRGAQRTKVAKVVAEKNLGGGVWRLKLLRKNRTESRYLILASCMHAGARIVRISRSKSDLDWAIEALASFEEHKSMNYGSDALVQGSSIKVVSTSFYDKLVCHWTFQDEA